MRAWAIAAVAAATIAMGGAAEAADDCQNADLAGQWKVKPIDYAYTCMVTMDRKGKITRSSCTEKGRQVGRLEGRMSFKRSCYLTGDVTIRVGRRAVKTKLYGDMEREKRRRIFASLVARNLDLRFWAYKQGGR